jgi:hypothetical protein
MTMEAGEFSAKAVSWDFGYTSNNNEQVAVEIQFLEGPNKGQSLTWYGGFSEEPAGEKTRTEWTLLDLRKLGWDGKDLMALDGMGSRTVRAKVEPDTYNGKTTMKIKRIFAGGGLALKNKMSDDAKKSFAERIMKSRPQRRVDDQGRELDDDGKPIPF